MNQEHAWKHLVRLARVLEDAELDRCDDEDDELGDDELAPGEHDEAEHAV
jgi:hypothetical protein